MIINLFTFLFYSYAFNSFNICDRDGITINGKIEHIATSRLNAYNAIYRFYLPPYAVYDEGSFKKTTVKYSDGSVQYNSQNNNNELILKVFGTNNPSNQLIVIGIFFYMLSCDQLSLITSLFLEFIVSSTSDQHLFM